MSLRDVLVQRFLGIGRRFMASFISFTHVAQISLCLLVTRATRSSYAPFALGQLDLAFELFGKAAPKCSPAAKALVGVGYLALINDSTLLLANCDQAA